jgi:nitroimidazol reductase NimA-like FMN-containing flavoprotein (pyridoxamine 5'-phosphate oxidase superfamily)
METPERAQVELENRQNIWIASVRPDGRPHLVPVWFAWSGGKIYLCIEPRSVKGINMRANPRVALALEEGINPVICEGTASFLDKPWPVQVEEVFKRKYDWDISTEAQYNQLVEITATKWLVW